MIPLSYVWIIFFVTLGPLKTIPLFFQVTRDFDKASLRLLAWKACLTATVTVFLIAIVMRSLMMNWQISLEALQITGGVMLFLSSMHAVTSFMTPPAPSEPWPQDFKERIKKTSLTPLAVPSLISPFGVVAILVAMGMATEDRPMTLKILGLLLLIMIVDFLSLLGARAFMKFVGTAKLIVIGWVFAILQAGLAVEVILRAFRKLGLITLILAVTCSAASLAQAETSVETEKTTGIKHLFTDKKVKVFGAPVFDTRPVKGETYGASVVTLLVDKETGAVHLSLSASGKYNSIVGQSGSVSARYYPHPFVNREENLSIRAEVARDYLRQYGVFYKNPHWGRFYVDTAISRLKSPFAVFYGLGAATPESNATAYVYKTDSILTTVGYHLKKNFRLNYGFNYTNTDLSNGVLNDLPNTLAVFTSLSQVTDAANMRHTFSAVVDTRPYGFFSRHGSFLSAGYFFSAKGLLSSHTLGGFSLEAIHLIPFWKERAVSAFRFTMQDMYGTDIPFYLQSSLGGQDELRAYNPGRFVDTGRVLFSFEQRFRVFKKRIFGLNIELNADPFVETGRVFHHLNHVGFKDFKTDAGLGVRILIPPNALWRIDFSAGNEGSTIYTAVTYPF